MNQTFKKKVLVASLASAFALVGAGVVSVPGVATMSVASANEFEATALAVNGSLSVAKAASTILTGTTAVFSESGTPIGGAGAVGDTVVLALSNSASWTSGIISGSGVAITGGASITVLAPSVGVGVQTLTAGGVAFLYTFSSAAGTPDTVTVGGTVLATTNRTTGSAFATASEAAALMSSAINTAFGAGTAVVTGGGANVITFNGFGAGTYGTPTANAVTGGGANVMGGTIVASLHSISTTKLTIKHVAGQGTGSGKITLRNMTVDTSGSATGSAVTLSVDSSSVVTGLTTGSSAGQTLATVSAGGSTTALASGQSVVSVLAGTTATLPTFSVTESVAGGITNGSFTITAPAGMTFGAGTGSVSNSRTISNGGGNCAVVTNVMTCTAASAGNGLPAAFTITGATLVVPPATAAGAIQVTVAGTGTTTQTISLATVVASGTVTAALYDAGTTGVATVYTGRQYASGSNGGGIVDGVALQESIAAMVANGSNINVTMANAGIGDGTQNFFNAATTTGLPTLSTATPSCATGGLTLFPVNNAAAPLLVLSKAGGYGTTGGTSYPFVNAFANGSGTWTVGATASTTACAARNMTFPSLTVGPTAGPVTATVNIPALGNLTSVTIANAVDATSATVSGSVVSLTAGTSGVVLPTVVVTETAAGALASSTGAPGTVSFTTVNNSFSITGTSAKWCGSALPASAIAIAAKVATVTLPNVSSTACALELTGSIDVNVASVPGTGESVTVNNLGTDTAQATYKSVLVGQVGTIGTTPVTSLSATPVVTGTTTSQTISSSMTPASNDLGKAGSVFVAAIVPASTGIGGVYFLTPPSTWTLYNGTATPGAYSTASSLAAVPTVSIVSTALNLTPIIGTDVYVGYGISNPFVAGSAFSSMLSAGTYKLVYTVK